MDAVLVCCGEKTAEHESKAVSLQTTPPYGHNLCIVTERIQQQIQGTEVNILQMMSGLTLAQEQGHSEGTQSRATNLLYRMESS